jgi:hypothetical protein
MNPYLHDALCEIGIYWCLLITAPVFISLLISGLDKLLSRILIHAERRKRRQHGFVMTADNIPGTNGYRIRTRMGGYHVYH